MATPSQEQFAQLSTEEQATQLSSLVQQLGTDVNGFATTLGEPAGGILIRIVSFISILLQHATQLHAWVRSQLEIASAAIVGIKANQDTLDGKINVLSSSFDMQEAEITDIKDIQLIKRTLNYRCLIVLTD